MDHLTQEIRERIIDGILDDFREDDALAKQIRDVYDEVDRRVLADADVIGVTTSGLARRISVLRHIESRVVICEEAGEVLEAHMLSALIPSVQHLIQIGDHQQLRPQIVNHKLSLESHSKDLYQLDRSQFERMALGESGLPAFPTSQLNVQRRMRPEVSTLIRNTLYERLVDSDTVKNLPNVTGMGKDVFWLDHENQEDAGDQEFRGRSKSNSWEVAMTHALVRHIVRQGVYGSKDIAVLTPYVGQLQKLRSALQNDFEIVLSDRDQETLIRDGHEDTKSDGEGHALLQKKSMSELLRIATVDNFQGEEAKVIIISLVRSNMNNKVGFLKTSNRINVLLSRAKHGMYLIGNSKTYANVPMWSNVLGMLRMTDSIGSKFSLHCDRHQETDAMVASPEDFEILSPQGGCRKQCDQRLPRCGHQCRSKCHSDALHKAFKCPLPCPRVFPCEHDCPKLCGEPCGLCMTVAHDIQLPCGHIKDKAPCHEAQSPEKVKCHILVKKSVPSCGHVATVPCFTDVSCKTFRCREPCQEILSCGHKCPGTCHSCAPQPQKEAGPKKTMHQTCKVVCGRKYGSCHHTCPRTCHDGEECGVCQTKCEVRCAHSKCPKKCFEACPPCVERCTWRCEHQGQCGLPCAAPCNRLPCSKRCTKPLQCGHQCPGVCGEHCPEGYCQICSDKGDARVDMLEFKSYSEIDLDESPIVVLGCGHFFTAETLDGHIGMHNAYETDKAGEYVALSRPSSLSQFIPRCPDCQSPIQQYVTQRYNRVINQAALDETSKRFIVSGNQRLAQFDTDIQDIEAQYRRVRESTTRPLSHHGQERETNQKLKLGGSLPRQIDLFVDEFSDTEHPIRKLHDATIKAMRDTQIESQMAGLSIETHVASVSLDQCMMIGGMVKLAKLHYTIVDHSIQMAKHHTPASAKKTVSSAEGLLGRIEDLIGDSVIENFPRMLIEVQLYYANVVLRLRSHRRVLGIETETTPYTAKAKEYLRQAEQLCAKGFQDAEKSLSTVKEALKLLNEYEEVTSEELEAIKLAMVSGRGGISTHSGHWYNCENGHPFAVGECGMPMELARCPECGAQVGGEHHRPAEGVSRATQMER
ncbi:AAA domain-containing protein [Aspergillus carlsbadensis]|nr:AAA domain-containing protein [Aspergillus carlsbadensis]